MDQDIKNTFKAAIIKRNLLTVQKLLQQEDTLAKVDLRPKEKQDHFTNGFAIVEAALTGPLYPFYELANHFLNKDVYGFKAPLSTSKDMIQIANLFLEYGFDDYHTKHAVDKMTPKEKAMTRLRYKGMDDYIVFLDSLS